MAWELQWQLLDAPQNIMAPLYRIKLYHNVFSHFDDFWTFVFRENMEKTVTLFFFISVQLLKTSKKRHVRFSQKNVPCETFHKSTLTGLQWRYNSESDFINNVIGE